MALRVLVVEDDALQRTTLAEILSFRGFEVVTAADGQAALDLVRKGMPDVIVLDLILPGLDGSSLLGELRKDPRFGATRVVVTTGLASPHVTRLLRPDATLFKPFEVRDLLRAVSGAGPGSASAVG